MRTCVSGVCGTTYPPTGTLLATQITGDCAVKVCNGAGIVVEQDDPTDAPPGGNCTTQTCMVGFPGKTLPPTSGNAKRIEAGDLNGDGKADVVLVDKGLSVLFGNGDGTFAPGVLYLPLSGVQAVAIGDLDGDGHPDMAVTRPGLGNPGPFFATVLLNDGDGGFTFGGDFTAETNVSWAPDMGLTANVAIGDVDGDGLPDLVLPTLRYQVTYLQPIPWFVTTSVKVLHGSGTGTFTLAGDTTLWSATGSTGLPTIPREPLDVRVADLDGDGKRDVVVANDGKGLLSVLHNPGNGTFAPAVTYPVPTQAFALGDVSGDGSPDLVVSVKGNGIGVLLNDGNGALAPVVTYPIPDPLFYYGGHPTLGDLDGDGHLDVVWVADTATVSVLHGNGNGTFAASVGYPCATALAVVAADLNGDGKLDLALPDGDAALSLLNEGNGTFPDDAPPAYPVGKSPRAVAIGDLNGDSYPDLAVLGDFGGSLNLLLGDGQGGFTAGPSVATTGLIGAYALALADLNGDGKLDIILDDGYVKVLLATGNGAFAPMVSYVITFGSDPQLGVGDLNGDGKPDIVNANGSVLLNNGDGTFAAAINNQWNAEPLTLGDFDGDGDLDVADVASQLEVRFNDGQGNFAPPVLYYDFPEDPFYAIAAGDINGDGKLDLVSSGGSVMFNVGNGAFTPGVHNAWGTATSHKNAVLGESPALADLDGDGVPDVVLPCATSVMIAREESNGQTSALFYSTVPLGGGAVAAGDLNGDGKPDIVVTGPVTNTVSVLLNQGCLP